jgi:hypothetical protein
VSGRVLFGRVAAIQMEQGYPMTEEQERETLRQMLFGSLALELPARAFEVLLDHYLRHEFKRWSCDQRGEAA